MSKVIYCELFRILGDLGSGKLDQYKSEHFSKELLKNYKELSHFFGCQFLFDRGETIPHFLDVKNLAPLPKVDLRFNKTFEQIVEERAESLVDTNRTINLFWSGGIDSTMVLVAILNAGISPSKLLVCMTEDSVKEYEWFWHKVINKLSLPVLNLNNENKRFDPDSIIVTGEFADQLLGSLSLSKYSDMEASDYYKKHIPEHIVNITQPMIDDSRLPIATLWDWLWYMNFRCKWQMVEVNSSISYSTALNITIADAMRRSEHFFNTQDFQQWAMHYNMGIPRKRTIAHHKEMLKRIIYDYTGDTDYYVNKQKEISRTKMNNGKLPTEPLVLEGGNAI